MKGLKIFYPALTWSFSEFVTVPAANDENISPDAA
jgi:hypothetical protein